MPHLMTVLPNHSFSILPSSVMVHSTLNARRSSSGLREHRSSQSRLGSMGTTVCTRYTEVAREQADTSRSVASFTK